jgi:hypothetical protein
MEMKIQATEAKDGHGMRHTPENRKQDGVNSPNYIAVFGILNAILERVSNSLPQIKEPSRTLPDDARAPSTDDEVGQSTVWR